MKSVVMCFVMAMKDEIISPSVLILSFPLFIFSSFSHRYSVQTMDNKKKKKQALKPLWNTYPGLCFDTRTLLSSNPWQGCVINQPSAFANKCNGV